MKICQLRSFVFRWTLDEKTLILVLVLGFLTSACSKHFIKPLTGTQEVPTQTQPATTTWGWIKEHPCYTVEIVAGVLLVCYASYWLYNNNPFKKATVPPEEVNQQVVQQPQPDDTTADRSDDSSLSSGESSQSSSARTPSGSRVIQQREVSSDEPQELEFEEEKHTEEEKRLGLLSSTSSSYSSSTASSTSTSSDNDDASNQDGDALQLNMPPVLEQNEAEPTNLGKPFVP